MMVFVPSLFRETNSFLSPTLGSRRSRELSPEIAASRLTMTPSVSPVSGVSNCYVFKSRLQEYTQKTGIATPVYETAKESPSHEPTFRSTVIVNNVRYESLPGFYNRKAAEQSAAEVAFLAILKSGNMSQFSHHLQALVCYE